MTEKKRKDTYETSFSFSLNRLYTFVIFSAIVAFAACVIISIVYDFEKSTATHCRVRNYLPSVSAAIGEFKPQKFIWQFFMAIHGSPRIFLSFMARKFYFSFSGTRQSYLRHALVQVMMWVEVLEVLSLLLLTIVSSTEAYWWHEKAFVTFVLSAQVNMLVKIAMFISLREHPQFSNNMERSLWMKVKFWFVNFTSIFLAAYFFYRHNTYCESGVYTLFALCEYVVVVSNIFFHATGFLEYANSGAVIHVGNLNNPFM